MLTQMDEVGTDIQPYLKGAPKSSKACPHRKQLAPSRYSLIFFLFVQAGAMNVPVFQCPCPGSGQNQLCFKAWAAFYHKYFIMIIPFSQNSKYFKFKYLLKSSCR